MRKFCVRVNDQKGIANADNDKINAAARTTRAENTSINRKHSRITAGMQGGEYLPEDGCNRRWEEESEPRA